jgi:hypothetical protein
MPDRRHIRDHLPLKLPEPCPICGAAVYLNGVTEWHTDDGEIIGVEYDCETEPDIDSREWKPWFRWHYRMPYVDWLPWEIRMVRWLNRKYHHRDKMEAPA